MYGKPVGSSTRAAVEKNDVPAKKADIVRCMATCPRCGGSSNRLLAPGYFECTSEIEEIVDLVPAHAHPGAGDIPVHEMRVCGTRFQSGEGQHRTSRCACGMFAVGACVECDEPLCGEHVARPDGRVLCSRHASAVERVREERQRRQAAAEQKRQDARWLARAEARAGREPELIRRLEAIEDPTERLVRAVVEIGSAETSELERYIPYSWDDREIGAWFARAAKVEPKEWPNGPRERKRLSWIGWKTFRAWHFVDGLRIVREKRHGTTGHESVSVLEDGRVYYDGGYGFEPPKNDGFRKEVLGEMWHLAELEPLDPKRRPPELEALRKSRLGIGPKIYWP